MGMAAHRNPAENNEERFALHDGSNAKNCLLAHFFILPTLKEIPTEITKFERLLTFEPFLLFPFLHALLSGL